MFLEGTVSKNGHPDTPRRRRYQRMSAVEKTEVLARVAPSTLPKRKALGELGVPRSTYYRWLRRNDQLGLRMIQEAASPHGTD